MKTLKDKIRERMTGTKYQLGCKKGCSDPRDHVQMVFSDIAKTFPKSSDLRKTNYLTPIRNQGSLGACTGFAITSLFEAYQRKKGIGLGKPLPEIYSPLFIYWFERQIEGTLPYDGGANIRDGMKVLNQIGVAFEESKGFFGEYGWPYDVSKFVEEPSWSSQFSAKYRKSSGYVALTTLDAMKSAILSGVGFVAGITCFSGIFSASNGDVPMPSDGETEAGGHALHFVSYDDDKQRLYYKNSWSQQWGNLGFGSITYQYAQKFLFDAWTLK